MDEMAHLLQRVYGYVEDLFAPTDGTLEGALRRSEEAGLPAIQVGRTGGRLLQLLVEISGSRRVLEIGTLGGYSTIYLARALPEGGGVVSLELSERHAEVARRNFEAAGLADRVEVRVGEAAASLVAMAEGGEGPFDLVFIDADKEGYPAYLEWALRLSRPGTVIVADNVLRGGSVLDPKDPTNRAVAEFNERLARDPRLSAIIIPFFKHRVDGFAVARVAGEL